MAGYRGYIIYTLNTVKLGPLSQYQNKEGANMNKTEIDILMSEACDRLRIAIRNERQVRDHAKQWRDMANTSTIQRRLRNEINNVQINVSFNKR